MRKEAELLPTATTRWETSRKRDPDPASLPLCRISLCAAMPVKEGTCPATGLGHQR